MNTLHIITTATIKALAITSLLPSVLHAQPISDAITQTDDASCQLANPLQIRFENNAGWDLCFDNRVRENLVITNLRYINVAGDEFPVLASGGISQLHVAYDDSAITYNDVTQFGLGDNFMLDLNVDDCPDGVILTTTDRPATCVTHQQTQTAYRTASRRASRESLNLFSVSQVGAYTYVLDWTLYDDGTIEPAVGATGALQRSSPLVDQPFGRVLSEDPDTQWLSHTHNYYWRLDFDLGDEASDDIVVETSQALDEDGHRVTSEETFTTEQARRIDPDTYRTWSLFEHTGTEPRGYRLAPQRHGHRLVRDGVEPYTDFDFFITVANDCERFASDNSLFNPECTSDVLEFANNESLIEQDLVAWHRVAFHHVPRNEDQRHMHTHWDAFQITPINLNGVNASTVNISNLPPSVEQTQAIDTSVGDPVNQSLTATDPDGDDLHFHAHDLPPGITLNQDGLFTGSALQAGDYIASITVSDDLAQVTVEQRFTISDGTISDGTELAANSSSSSKGFFGSVNPFWLGLFLFITRRRKGL